MSQSRTSSGRRRTALARRKALLPKDSLADGVDGADGEEEALEVGQLTKISCHGKLTHVQVGNVRALAIRGT